MREVDLALVDGRDHAVGAALDQHGFELDPFAREEALALRHVQIERADIAHGGGDFAEAQRGLRRRRSAPATDDSQRGKARGQQAFHG